MSAINDPTANPPTILLSQQAWSRMEKEAHKRVFLAFHEYLGILGVDDSNYQVSARLDRAQVCERHPAIRKEIEKGLKKSCYRIIPDDMQYVEGIYAADGILNRFVESDFRQLSLRTLQVSRNTLEKVDLNVLKRMDDLFFLNLGSSVESLNDCSFLNQKTKLDSLWLSDSGYGENASKFRALKSIAPGCFSKIGSPLLQTLLLAIDGEKTQLTGFLKDIPAMERGYIKIDGINLNKIPVTEFSNMKNYFYFAAYDNSLTESYLKEVSAVSGKKCKLNPPRSNNVVTAECAY